MNEEFFLKIIKDVFEESVTEYKVKAGTYGNVVFEINQEWVFRFSREAMDVRQLEIEKSFLPEFEKVSPLPIPHIKYKGNGFVGYKKLDGVPFTEEICKSLSDEQRNSIWESVGKFLN